MSLPTFNGVELVSAVARDLPGSPAVRLHAETLPGADGAYVQPHGHSAREIVVHGVLSASAGTPAAAHQALKAALRTRQTLADGAAVAAYVGADGATYTHCMLMTYAPAGEVEAEQDDTACQARLPIEAKILHLTP